MKHAQTLFWIAVAVFVVGYSHQQDADPKTVSYMARVDFINGTAGPTQQPVVDVAINDVE